MVLKFTRRIALAFGGVALTTTLATGFVSPAFADEAAEAYVAEMLIEANGVFEADTEAERFEGIAKMVDSYVDMRRVGLFVLGPYARRMSPEQKEEYLPLFKKFATQIYQGALSQYSGQKLEVTESIDRSERDIIVNSKIADAKPGDQFADATVHWRIYRRNGKMAIVDAGAEGIWLAIEQQSQFKSIISNNGGGSRGIDALIADLKSRVGE